MVTLQNLRDFPKLSQQKQWELASGLMEQHGAAVVVFILDEAARAMSEGDHDLMKALEILSEKIDELNGDHSANQPSSTKPYLN